VIKICTTAFDPWQEIQAYQTAATQLKGQYGATAVFVGTLRDFNQGDAVTGMTLEHYPGMTEKVLAKIIDEAGQQSAIIGSLCVHRVGEVYPDQPIVLVAAWAAHRGDAFDACRTIMEALKTTAPFWKKEQLASNQSRWVEGNSTGYLRPPETT
jgi:molybdopterin synthase catalytic subunit